jgi:hypothetical protein
MAYRTRARTCALLFSALLLSCGAGGDETPSPASDSVEPARSGSAPAPGSEVAPAVPAAAATVTQESAGASPAPEAAEAAPAAAAPCSPPAGVSGSPHTFQEAVALINALPKPTTLPCFLESLDRPLELYLTRSELSLQPADGPERPRTFIVFGELVLSVVTTQKFISRLELGHRTAPGRSVKGEIAFPLTRDVTAADITERIRVGNVSICGGCHGAETRPTDPFFPDGAFESAIAVPLSPYEVDLQALRAQAAACDRAQDPDRCAQLSALFDHGEVRRSALWDGG